MAPVKNALNIALLIVAVAIIAAAVSASEVSPGGTPEPFHGEVMARPPFMPLIIPSPVSKVDPALGAFLRPLKFKKYICACVPAEWYEKKLLPLFHPSIYEILFWEYKPIRGRLYYNQNYKFPHNIIAGGAASSRRFVFQDQVCNCPQFD